MNPPENPPNTTLVVQRSRPRARVERVVGAVLDSPPEERGVPRRRRPRRWRWPRSPSRTRRRAAAGGTARPAAVADAQGEDRLRHGRRWRSRSRRCRTRPARGRAARCPTTRRCRSRRRAPAPGRRRRSGTPTPGCRWRGWRRRRSRRYPRLPVHVDAEEHHAVDDHGRREDAGAVGRRVGGLAGRARVVVAPVHAPRWRRSARTACSPRRR